MTDHDHINTEAEDGETRHKRTPDPDFRDLGADSMTAEEVLIVPVFDSVDEAPTGEGRIVYIRGEGPELGRLYKDNGNGFSSIEGYGK
jgi:hypothetical protein